MTSKIMVVDDEALICQLLMHQLGISGYEVVTFQSGTLALEHLLIENPDLVLLDVMMPEISGWDLCRQIRACSAVPVIMLTSKQGDNDTVVGLNSGADDYIIKPFHLAPLLARIEAVLRRARPANARESSRLLAAHNRNGLTTTMPIATSAPQSATLSAASQPETLSSDNAPSLPSQLGPRLAATRKQRGLSLHSVESACGIRWEYLQALEQENFVYIPHDQQHRVMRIYSAFLQVDISDFVEHKAPRALYPWTASWMLGATLFVVMVIMIGLYML